MSRTVEEITRGFAGRLDARQYELLSEVLAKDCRYDFAEQSTTGPDAIIQIYRDNTEWAFQCFERIEFASRVVVESATQAVVEFTDRIYGLHTVHEYRCRQRIRVNAVGRIEHIEHIEIPGEREALNAFFDSCGVCRPT